MNMRGDPLRWKEKLPLNSGELPFQILSFGGILTVTFF